MVEKEENLIRQACAGKRDSFGKLYDIHQPKIYRFIILKVGNKEESEDITHQVFLSAWQNIKSFRIKEVPFSSWLYKIAKNKIIDYYRSKKPVFSIESVDENTLKSSSFPELLTEKSMELEKIRNAMTKITEEQQDVLIMRFIEDLPIKEVAVTLNKSIGAIKLIQFRAINKLKKILKEENGENN
ncbi:MAG: RNA polymerase sigma factor [Candidatus Pacebacteria bacterium]|nr:RNA polymerase sigma factor [Candidatus Paceibacterota bacterium]